MRPWTCQRRSALFELEGQLQEKRVALVVDEEAKTWLAEHGYDAEMGARPMARVRQEQVKKPLTNEILPGALSRGGTVHIGVEDGELSFDCEEEAVH